MATQFFNPSSIGNITGWEVQTGSDSTSLDRAQALGADGDEIASQTHNSKISATTSYVIKATNASVPKLGAIINGYHIDSIAITFNATAFVMMSLTGHKHGSTAHPACRTYSLSISTISQLFGCPSTIPCGLTVATGTGTGVRSITFSASLNHVDELNNVGNFLAADNYDGKETITVQLCDTANCTAQTGWDITSSGDDTGNTSAETTSTTAEHHIAHDTEDD